MDNKDALRERVADLEKENADWLKAIAFLRQTKADLTAENEALIKLIEEAMTNCETCRGEPVVSRMCARCQTFYKAIIA